MLIWIQTGFPIWTFCSYSLTLFQCFILCLVKIFSIINKFFSCKEHGGCWRFLNKSLVVTCELLDILDIYIRWSMVHNNIKVINQLLIHYDILLKIKRMKLQMFRFKHQTINIIMIKCMVYYDDEELKILRPRLKMLLFKQI